MQRATGQRGRAWAHGRAWAWPQLTVMPYQRSLFHNISHCSWIRTPSTSSAALWTATATSSCASTRRRSRCGSLCRALFPGCMCDPLSGAYVLADPTAGRVAATTYLYPLRRPRLCPAVGYRGRPPANWQLLWLASSTGNCTACHRLRCASSPLSCAGHRARPPADRRLHAAGQLDCDDHQPRV